MPLSKMCDRVYVPGWELAPEGPGVYVLFSASVCIYVGSTARLRARVKSHPHRRITTSFQFVECPMEGLKNAEQALIDALRPTLNRGAAARLPLHIVRRSTATHREAKCLESYKPLPTDTPLAKVRKEARLTKAEAATLLSIHRSHYGRVECGETAPSLFLSREIYRLFDGKVTFEQIFALFKKKAA